MDERYVEMVVRTARMTESVARTAAGRYSVISRGYTRDVQAAEVMPPNLLMQNFPNPSNEERKGRELTDEIELSVKKLQMLSFKLAA